MLGRGDKFLSFHPAHPKESIRINLLANWTRPSEIADRIASLIPSASESDPFKNFAFGALNAICNGLCNVYRNPTLKNLRKLFKSTLNNRLHRNLACVIDKSSRGAKLERAFEELP